MPEPKQKLVVDEGWLEPFVAGLRSKGVRVLAPVELDGEVEFREIDSAQQMAQAYINTRVPLKEILFPRSEVLLTYDKAPGEDADFHGLSAEPQPTVVMGARPCDLSGLGVLDTVFNWDYKDATYNQRRASTTFVGFACTEADSHCFCDAVGGGADSNDGSDVLVRPLQNGGALLDVMNERGEAIAAAIEGAKPATGSEDLVAPPATKAPFDPDKVKAWIDSHFDD